MRRRKDGMTETQLVRQCLEWLNLHGIMAWRNNTTGVYDPVRKKFRTFTGLKGVSDILGVLPGGRLLAVEVKRPGELATAHQVEFLARVSLAGGLAIVAHSIEELERGVKA